jgi:hypothetical protein
MNTYKPKPTGVKVDTVHITDGKVFHVVNKPDFDAGKYPDFKPVSEKKKAAKKTTKKSAKKAKAD